MQIRTQPQISRWADLRQLNFHSRQRVIPSQNLIMLRQRHHLKHLSTLFFVKSPQLDHTGGRLLY